MHALCSSHTLCWPSGLWRDSPVARVFHAIGPPKGAVTLHGRDISLNSQVIRSLRLTHVKARREIGAHTARAMMLIGALLVSRYGL